MESRIKFARKSIVSFLVSILLISVSCTNRSSVSSDKNTEETMNLHGIEGLTVGKTLLSDVLKSEEYLSIDSTLENHKEYYLNLDRRPIEIFKRFLPYNRIVITLPYSSKYSKRQLYLDFLNDTLTVIHSYGEWGNAGDLFRSNTQSDYGKGQDISNSDIYGLLHNFLPTQDLSTDVQYYIYKKGNTFLAVSSTDNFDMCMLDSLLYNKMLGSFEIIKEYIDYSPKSLKLKNAYITKGNKVEDDEQSYWTSVATEMKLRNKGRKDSANIIQKQRIDYFRLPQK